MLEEAVNIIRVVAQIDNAKSYANELNDTTTFDQFKKILAGAAHLFDTNFDVYYENAKIPDSSNEKKMSELFPNANIINLNIATKKDISAYEDELISLNFDISAPCNIHSGKYKMLFCIDCNKSICNECLNFSHKKHLIKEKADYLLPAKALIKNIFHDSSAYNAQSNKSNAMDCLNFSINLKNNVFPEIRKQLDDLEHEVESSLQFFRAKENEAKQFTNENVELLEEFCIESFIKLKNDISTNRILVDDNIFRAIYSKLEQISQYKEEYFNINLAKYRELNMLLSPFMQEIKKIVENVKAVFDDLLKNEIYKKFKADINKNAIGKITRKEVDKLIFRSIKVERKSLKKSLFKAQTNKGAKKLNCDEESAKNLNNQLVEEVNPFVLPKSKSKKDEEQFLSEENNICTNNLDNSASIKEESIVQKKQEENANANCGNSYQNDSFIQPINSSLLNNIDSNIESKNNNNIANISEIQGTLFGNNKNALQAQKNFQNNNPFFENPFLFRNSNNNALKKRLSVQCENKSPNRNNIFANINISSSKDDKISTNPKQEINNNNNKIMQTLFSKSNLGINSNDFGSKENRINEFRIEEENKTVQKNCSNANALVERKQQNFNENSVKPDEKKNKENICIDALDAEKSEFVLFYPQFNSNILYAILKDKKIVRFVVDFDQEFSKAYALLNKFSANGAFCNLNGALYFSGGEGIQRVVGKLFFKIYVNKDSTGAKVIIEKMPYMKSSHSSHSMVAFDNNIFIVGGYNSNKCKLFDLRNSKWEMLPNLNSKERQRAMLCIANDYLYAFMGFTQDNILNTVERICLKKLDKWEQVEVANPNAINLNFYGAGTYVLNQTIYFIGGKIGKGTNDEDYKYSIYSYNIESNNIEDCNVVFPRKLHFIENKLFKCKDGNIGHMIDEKEAGINALF